MRQTPAPSVSLAVMASHTGRAAQTSSSDAEEQPRGLRAMQVVFIIVTLVTVTMDALAIPVEQPLLSTPDVLRELHRIHFSPTLYAAIVITESMGYAVIYLAMALLLFWHRPHDRMAIFCALTLVLFGCATTSGFLYNISSGATTPLLGNSLVVHYILMLLFSAGQICFLLFFYLFPSGRLAPSWTRWLAALAALYWLAAIFSPAIPAGPAGSIIYVFVASAVIAQVYRYLRVSTPSEREQTKWVVFGIALGISVIVVSQIALAFLPQTETGPIIDNSPLIGNLVGGLPWQLGLALIPIFIAIAVARSHLWAIDTLINRALVYSALSALLAAVYAAMTIGLQRLSGLVTGSASQQPVVIVLTTLTLVALFHPLRSRIQRTIDRRFYRRKYDAAQTVAAFSATLRQEVDLDELRSRLLVVVAETMQPRSSSLWLRPSQDPHHERA